MQTAPRALHGWRVVLTQIPQPQAWTLALPSSPQSSAESDQSKRLQGPAEISGKQSCQQEGNRLWVEGENVTGSHGHLSPP